MAYNIYHKTVGFRPLKKTYGTATFEFPKDGTLIKVTGDSSELTENDLEDLKTEFNAWTYHTRLARIKSVMDGDKFPYFKIMGIKDMLGWSNEFEEFIYRHINGNYYSIYYKSALQPDSFLARYHNININKYAVVPPTSLHKDISLWWTFDPDLDYFNKFVNSNQIKLCVISFVYNKKRYCEIAAFTGKAKLYTFNKKSMSWEYLFTDKPDLTIDQIGVYKLKQTISQKHFNVI